MNSGLYKHFKGGVYCVFGDAAYLPQGVEVVLINDAIAKHESSDAEASVYYDSAGQLYITSVKSRDEEMLGQGSWTIYTSLGGGPIWFRPTVDFSDEMDEKQTKRFERIS